MALMNDHERSTVKFDLTDKAREAIQIQNKREFFPKARIFVE